MAEETLFSGESKNIEYKVAVPDKSEKYMKTVVAFANGRGGKIVFGIEDKTLEVAGMDEHPPRRIRRIRRGDERP